MTDRLTWKPFAGQCYAYSECGRYCIAVVTCGGEKQITAYAGDRLIGVTNTKRAACQLCENHNMGRK